IETATLLEKPCVRPADFDLEAYWTASTEKLREGWSTYRATLRLAPSAAERMTMWRAGPPDGRPDAEGWFTRVVSFDDEEQACFVVLGLGPRVDVIEPRSLRDRVAADVAAVAARASAKIQGE